MKAHETPTVPASIKLALSRTEAAVALGVHVNTIDSLVRVRRLRPVHVGRRIIFPLPEIQRFLQSSPAAA